MHAKRSQILHQLETGIGLVRCIRSRFRHRQVRLVSGAANYRLRARLYWELQQNPAGSVSKRSARGSRSSECRQFSDLFEICSFWIEGMKSQVATPLIHSILSVLAGGSEAGSKVHECNRIPQRAAIWSACY